MVGLCLWDIFSEGNEVRASDGRWVDLGSFRGTAGVLADWLNRQCDTERYDYLDFYMGTINVGGRADLTPVYEMIFRRLRRCEANWVYNLPRLSLVALSRPADVEGPAKAGDWQSYDPSAAVLASTSN